MPPRPYCTVFVVLRDSLSFVRIFYLKSGNILYTGPLLTSSNNKFCMSIVRDCETKIRFDDIA